MADLQAVSSESIGGVTVKDMMTVLSIAVELLEKLLVNLVITPDSEEGEVITPDFTTPVKGFK